MPTLTSSDGANIEISNDFVARSQLINDLTEDLNPENIFIPEVSEDILYKVIQWCQQDKPSKPCMDSDILQIIKRTQTLINSDLNQLFEIIKAANYLAIDDLLDIACKTAVYIFNEKFLNESRRSFGISDDSNKYIPPNDEWAELNLLDLPYVLVEKILLEIPNTWTDYFQRDVESMLALEIGNFGTTKESAFSDLVQVVEGANDLNVEVKYCETGAIRSFPGCENRISVPVYVTDGLHLLCGSDSSKPDLVIFDIVKAENTILDGSMLVQKYPGWPKYSHSLEGVAFYSGLLIFNHTGEVPSCFQLDGSNLTEITPPKEFLEACRWTRHIAISRELICVDTTVDGATCLLAFGRDFLLRGKAEIGLCDELYIRGRKIIGLGRKQEKKYEDATRVVWGFAYPTSEIWQIKDTNDIQSALVHLRSNVSSRSDSGWGRKLSLGHNLDKAICYKVGASAFSDDSLLAQRFSREERDANFHLVCIDMLASQYFAVLKQEILKADEIGITLKISNTRHIKETKKRIRIIVCASLGACIKCFMFFSTIVLVFKTGIMRVKLEGYAKIYNKVVLNSGSLNLGQAQAV